MNHGEFAKGYELECNYARVLRASEFAIQAHKDQYRKFSNEPYVSHCIRVAQLVAKHGGTENMIIAALLHDVLEDCPHISPFDILENFGVEVLRMVKDLTDPPKEAGNRSTRNLMTIERLKSVPWDSQSIKCADFLDNAESMIYNDVDFGPRWLKEKAEIIPLLKRAIPTLHKAAIAELHRLQKYIEDRNGLVSSTG